MRRNYAYVIALMILTASLCAQQRFRPYHAFGLEAGANYGQMKKESGRANYGPTLRQYQFNFDILASYDYAPFSWLGISSGLGVSARGGKGFDDHRVSRFASESMRNSKSIYYLNIPIKLQIKLGFVWLEPGVEHKFPFGVNSANDNSGSHVVSLDRTDLKNYHLDANVGGRINFFRGLSLSLGYGWALTPLAYMEDERYPHLFQTAYYNRYYYLRLRYMFNQPLKKK